MTIMSGRKAIMDLFQAEGVAHIFGNPGTTELPFIDILQDYPDMTYILALQEGVALGIAHMYAIASGKTGVANLHVAPGLGNATGALYNAAKGHAPLVVTVGQQDGRMAVREPVLSHDLVSMAKPLTKWAIEIRTPEEIPVIVPRAFKLAQDPPKGPVLLSLPTDVLEGEAEFPEVRIGGPYHRATRPDPAGISAAVEILCQAENPMIICGDGVSASGALAEVAALADLIGAQVYDTMFTGDLNFPMSLPNYRGNLTADYQTIRPMLQSADAILTVGAEVFTEVFYTPGSPIPEGCRLIQLNCSSWEIGKNIPADVGLLADPKLALQDLTGALETAMDGDAKKKAGERRKTMAAQKEEEIVRHQKRAQSKWESVPISPARLMVGLKNCLPESTVFFNEGITASVDVTRALQPSAAGSYYSGAGGGIGQALPGAIGLKLANPDRPVVAIVGDGSAMYTIQSLWTAAHHKIPVIYVIISNQSYRILKYNMNRFRRVLKIEPKTEPHPFMDLDDPPLNFVEIARGMGMAAKRVTRPDEIEHAAKEALEANVPYLLEVITEKKVPLQ
jgi:benzoylformate decarboxylase